MSFNLKITGATRVANRLRTAAAKMPRTVDAVVKPWGQQMRATLKATKYPRKRPNQKYIRTGKLGNSWSSRSTRPGQIAIRNSAPYAIYVIGDQYGKRQAWMHAGRWWIARSIIDEHAPELVTKLTAAIKRDLGE